MTIFTEQRVRDGFLEEYEAPLSDVLGATAEESLLYSPLSSVMRQRELSRARRGDEPNVLDYRVFGDEKPSTASPFVDSETARKRVADEGLELTVPDDGIRQRALDILIERKRDERRRQDAFVRSPKGFGVGAARLGTALGASLLDPLNVASAFVPVVGPTRYAMMLERAGSALGRTGVRLGVGAVEGAAGAALVEPLVYGAARSEQADYGLADSLLNIAFGTVLGGGLHAGLGAAGDAVARGLDWRRNKPVEGLPGLLDEAPLATREAALRTSVAQAVTGRAIDVDPVIRQSLADDWNPNVLFRDAEAPAAPLFRLGPFFGNEYARYTPVRGGDRKWLDGLVAELETTEPGSRVFLERDGQGGTADVIGIPATTPQWFQSLNRQAGDINAIRRGEMRRGVEAPTASAPIVTRKMVADVVGKMLRHDPLGKREGEIARELFEQARLNRVRNAEQILGSRQGRRSREDASIDAFAARELQGMTPDEIREFEQGSFAPENLRLADFESSRAADDRLASWPENRDGAVSTSRRWEVETAEDMLLADALEDARGVARLFDYGDEAEAALAQYDDLAATAASYGRAVQAAASCQLRRGV